eukprot:1195430-Prorocentrum_minimum.AAC.1
MDAGHTSVIDLGMLASCANRRVCSDSALASKGPRELRGLWGVESTLAVIGTGGPLFFATFVMTYFASVAVTFAKKRLPQADVRLLTIAYYLLIVSL